MSKWVHTMSDVDIEQRTGICGNCGTVQVVWNGRRWRCAESKRLSRRRSGNITTGEADALLQSQGGNCAICASGLSIGDSTACVDHCHTSGKVRGVLCRNCNIGLGYFKDDPALLQNSIDYLRNSLL
jgi:hypothetical protein